MQQESSIDKEELNKFNKTYSEWWDTNGEFKTLHQINPIRIEYIISKIKRHFGISGTKKHLLSGLSLLDVGSGGGLISVPMSQFGAKVTGLDANKHNVKAAEIHAKEHKLNINYLNTTIEQHIYSEEKYDIILCLEVMEHVAHPDDFIVNLSKLLNPGGLLIISTINRTVKSYLLAIVGAEYVLRWVPVKTHNYSKFIKPSELVRISQNTSLKIEELKGLIFSVLQQDWLLSDDIDVNYFAVFSMARAI
jgi:2-polyprenyl-6-hydroxyphenyl methylase/3-demethylubiquinone-9 3-methyltransferase